MHGFQRLPPVGGVAESRVRIRASDLEQLVLREMAKRFRDDSWLLQTFGAGLGARQAQHLLRAGRLIAKQFSSSTDGTAKAPGPAAHDQVRAIIDRIVVDTQRISIALAADAVLARLGEIDTALASITLETQAIPIDIAAHRLRCGKQVKLVVGQIETVSREIDQRLVTHVANARRWFEDLGSGRRSSIAEIARKEHREVSAVSRGISLAFLAPDIVEMILCGRQPVTLTPDRLKACRPLPLDWAEQRALLLDH